MRRKVTFLALVGLAVAVPSLVLFWRLPTFDRACAPDRFPLDYWRFDRELNRYERHQPALPTGRLSFLVVTDDGFPWRTGTAQVIGARERDAVDPSLAREGIELIVTVERVSGVQREWEIHDAFVYDNGEWALSSDIPSSMVLEGPPVPADYRSFMAGLWEDGHNGFCDPALAREVASGPPVSVAGVQSPLRLGRRTFIEYRCGDCHGDGPDGQQGGDLHGLFGKVVTLQDGTRVTVDGNYLAESILEPDAKIRAGVSARMPAFRGKLKDAKVWGLAMYIETLK